MAEEPKIARRYMAVNDKDKDDQFGSRFIPDVPKRNITEEEWKALPDHVKATVDASPFFAKPTGKKKAAQEAPPDAPQEHPGSPESDEGAQEVVVDSGEADVASEDENEEEEE